MLGAAKHLLCLPEIEQNISFAEFTLSRADSSLRSE
jgi:hypothetical protein